MSKPQPYKLRNAIAMDINERKIVYGDDKINKERDTEIDEAHIWKLLAESLQKKIFLSKVSCMEEEKGDPK